MLKYCNIPRSKALFSSLRRRASTEKSDATYQRLTLTEHILLRPGMYIGQVEPAPHDTWVYNHSEKIMEKRNLVYSPALLKVFDEIVVNAADNYFRDTRMSSITIDICRSNGFLISIRNDGKGLPVELDPKECIYVPALVFGHLLSGSNFNDNEVRLTGGRHGYGAKLTNIFSNSFEVETYDSKKKLLYKQRWENNMKKSLDPVIESADLPKDYTKISFQPDLEKFFSANSMTKSQLLDDITAMFYRRSIDVAAGLPSVAVTFNGERIQVNSFGDYVKLFCRRKASLQEEKLSDDTFVGSSLSKETVGPQVLYAKVNNRWEVGVMRSPSGSFESMSFVNSVWTPAGGSHVTLVTNQIVKSILESLEKKGLKAVNPGVIRNRLFVFVNCKVENPSFDSQSKSSLSSKPSSFGSECNLTQVFLKRVESELGIVDEILLDLKFREESALLKASTASKSGQKSQHQLVEVPKLEDAHFAGHATKSEQCTLILTEGDSAKALAIAGMEVVGREYYGVLPLRGKLLNAREVTPKQLAENQELMNICKALGLNFQKKYDSGLKGSGLRYGHVLLMCDQDNDGSHIKGLLLNFLHRFFPGLLQVEGFLQQFSTPLVKARLAASKTGKQKPAGGGGRADSEVEQEGRTTKVFYSMAEYFVWRKQVEMEKNDSSSSSRIDGGDVDGASDSATLTANEDIVVPSSSSSSSNSSTGPARAGKYLIKYYKGLGTSTAEEGKEYFRALDRHRKTFYPGGKEDDVIDLAFSRHRASDRRKWLTQRFDAESFIDPTQQRISYEDFINKEMIQYSFADCQRSIPSAIDGLKPSQRKVLYSCLKRNLDQDMKVVQLGGYVAEQTAYHHGEASLYSTIVRMAQDYVGSNNYPLLVASGQFGTRAQGGKDFASPRYIFTRLAPITRALFPQADDAQLEYLEEDGQPVEPKFFVPIIPTLLVNGCQGIGTGWSSSVPPFHPLELTEYMQKMVRGEAGELPALHPWIRAFNGAIEISGPDYITNGIVNRVNDTTVEITELPYGKWTHDYKEFLCRLMENDTIKSFRENHTTNSVKFTIKSTKTAIDELQQIGFVKSLKLQSTIGMGNMHAFNKDGVMTHYSSPEDIIAEHFDVRLEAYNRRKIALLRKYASEEAIARNKSRFVASVISGDISLLRRDSGGAVNEGDIVKQLQAQGFASAGEIEGVSRGLSYQGGGSGAAGVAGFSSSSSSSSSTVSEDKGKIGSGDFDFSYLLGMPIHSLTDHKYQVLQRASEASMQKLHQLQVCTEKDLWARDLDVLAQQIRAELGSGSE